MASNIHVEEQWARFCLLRGPFQHSRYSFFETHAHDERPDLQGTSGSKPFYKHHTKFIMNVNIVFFYYIID